MNSEEQYIKMQRQYDALHDTWEVLMREDAIASKKESDAIINCRYRFGDGDCGHMKNFCGECLLAKFPNKQ
jgi:hypothetical protein